MEPRIVGCIT